MRVDKRAVEALTSFFVRRECRAIVHAARRGKPMDARQRQWTSPMHTFIFDRHLMTPDEIYAHRMRMLKAKANAVVLSKTRALARRRA